MSWIDRVVEFPNRFKLTPVSGQENTYDLEPKEGNVYVEGTLLNAESLNVETKNLAQNEIETFQGDYVVEDGADGNWKYRKWNSGRYEAWYRANARAICETLIDYSWYRTGSTIVINYPHTLTEVAFCDISFQSTTSTTYASIMSVTNSSVGYMVQHLGSVDINGYAMCHVVGSWK